MPPRSSVSKILAQRRAHVASAASAETPRTSSNSDVIGCKAVDNEPKLKRLKAGGKEVQHRETSTILRGALHGALSAVGAACEWQTCLVDELEARIAAGIPPESARKWLRSFRRLPSCIAEGTGATLINNLKAQASTDESLSARSMFDHLIVVSGECRAGSVDGDAPCRVAAKTAISRFEHVSDELSCPRGCRGSIRYGYRVGDLGKYAAMERSEQLSSVLCYCQICFDEFSASL